MAKDLDTLHRYSEDFMAESHAEAMGDELRMLGLCGEDDVVTPGVVGAGKKRLLSEDEEEAEESPSGSRIRRGDEGNVDTTLERSGHDKSIHGTADTVGLNLVVHVNTQHFSSKSSRKIHMKNMIQRGHLQRRVDAKKTKVTKLRTS